MTAGNGPGHLALSRAAVGGEPVIMRLTLSLRGDYAVRTMLALGEHREDGLLSAARIAERMQIPVRFVAHVLADLTRAGLVSGRPGRRGGYRLSRPADQISLLHIVDAAEDRGDIARCVLRGGPCDPRGRCAVHDAFAAANTSLERELAGSRLSDLVAKLS
ncbi:MAG: Rrf2 family transcriptional regulator [Chloroflexi bacterium]|nr:Rrf2 family transcriptional regulator [Chloroflexota bacterium]